MRWLNRVWSFFRGLARRKEDERELDAEVRGYAEMLGDEKTQGGMDERDAQRSARIEMGGIEQVKEEVRSARAGVWLETLWQDVRFAARMLRKRPGFTVVSVLTLALVIGANTAIFSAIYGLAFRRLPYRDSSRLVMIWDDNRIMGLEHTGIVGQTFPILSGETKSFADLAGFGYTNPGEGMYVTKIWGTDVGVAVASFSSQLPSVLGVAPLLGRTFTAAEDVHDLGPLAEGNAAAPVVLSYDYWREHYGASPDALGKIIVLDSFGLRSTHTIVGVMPQGFDFPYPLSPDKPDIWFDAAYRTGRFVPERGFCVVGHLKDGASLKRAQAELDTISSQIGQQYPKYYGGEYMVVGALQSELIRNAKTVLWVLLAAIGLVLMIGCANIGNLLLVRAVEREREMALRRALGAGLPALLRQVFAEAALLAGAGGALGFLLAHWMMRAFVALMPASLYVPRIQEVTLDFRALAVTSLVSTAVATLFGVLPSLRLLRPDASASLRSGSGPARPRGSIFGRPGSLLLVSEISLTLVLLTGAMMFAKSLEKLIEVNLHFQPEHLLTMDVLFSNAAGRLRDFDKRKLVLRRQFLEDVKATPGVSEAAFVDTSLLSPGMANELKATGGTGPISQDFQNGVLHYATPNYFDMMGMQLVRGRWLTDSDIGDSAGVAVINDVMAERYWPDTNPIGLSVTPLERFSTDESYKIVGIVHEPKRFGSGEAPPPAAYVPYDQTPLYRVTVVVRSADDPREVGKALRSVALNVLPGLMTVGPVQTGEELVSKASARSRFTTLLVSALSGLALLLAIIGIYGLISYYTVRRTHEIGVRMALGGQRGDILRLVLKQAAGLVGVGMLFGIIGSIAFARGISGLLYGVRPTDWTAFGGAALILMAVGLTASYIPARRATRVDPMVALRYE